MRVFVDMGGISTVDVVLPAMMRDEGLELTRVSKAFANDLLLRRRVERPAAFW